MCIRDRAGGAAVVSTGRSDYPNQINNVMVLSLIHILLVLVLSAVGLVSMWAAVFADVGVSVIAILNAMRALKAGK